MKLNALMVRYIVNDVDAAIGFYTRHLGFRLGPQASANFAILERDVHDASLLEEPDALPIGRELERALVPRGGRDLARDRWVRRELIERVGEKIRLTGDVRRDDDLLAIGAQRLYPDVHAHRHHAETRPDAVEDDAHGS